MSTLLPKSFQELQCRWSRNSSKLPKYSINDEGNHSFEPEF